MSCLFSALSQAKSKPSSFHTHIFMPPFPVSFLPTPPTLFPHSFSSSHTCLSCLFLNHARPCLSLGWAANPTSVRCSFHLDTPPPDLHLLLPLPPWRKEVSSESPPEDPAFLTLLLSNPCCYCTALITVSCTMSFIYCYGDWLPLPHHLPASRDPVWFTAAVQHPAQC